VDLAFLAAMLRKLVLVAVVAGLAMATGCDHSAMVRRPESPKLDAAYTTMWVDDLHREVQDGDLILRRGYAVLSDVITLATSGPDMSHASIYDAVNDKIIDAVDGGVREVTPAQFVGAAHHWMIVRPRGLSAAQRRVAVLRARSVLGTPFDYSGFVGIDNPDRFYCSELVAWAYGALDDLFAGEILVPPGELLAMGPVIYDSGDRGAAPLMNVTPYWQ
jgi:Permuted papain-like amidase enzyme, YaeF/YiiX, C92 family